MHSGVRFSEPMTIGQILRQKLPVVVRWTVNDSSFRRGIQMTESELVARHLTTRCSFERIVRQVSFDLCQASVWFGPSGSDFRVTSCVSMLLFRWSFGHFPERSHLNVASVPKASQRHVARSCW